MSEKLYSDVITKICGLTFDFPAFNEFRDLIDFILFYI